MIEKHADRRSSMVETFGLVSRHSKPLIKQRSHHHNEIELNFIEQGSLVYLYGNQAIELAAGRLAVFWGAIPHHITNLEETTSLYWLTLPLPLIVRWELPNLLTQQLLSGAFLVESGPGQPAVDQVYFQRWHSDLLGESASRRITLLLEVQARLRRLAEKIDREPSGFPSEEQAGVVTASFDKARSMAGFIIAHYTELISVQQVAAAAQLHPDHAMRIFRRNYQVSILEYLTRYRLAHAQRLLMTTNKPIAQVAQESGFGSTSQFYATFKTILGIPPGKFRQQAAFSPPSEG